MSKKNLKERLKQYFSLINLLKAIGVFLLFYATARHKYSYYSFLRVYVSVTSVYFAYISNEQDSKPWLVIFSIIAILFNPIAPIYLDRSLWAIIDITCGIVVIVSIFFQKENIRE